jgi:hypothetical protein
MAACVCYHSITASFRYLLWCLKLSRHTYIVVVTCDGSPVVKASISANLAYLFFRSCHRNWSYQSLVCVTNCLVGHSNDNFVGVFCVWWSRSRAWGEVIAMTLGGYLHDEFLFTGVCMLCWLPGRIGCFLETIIFRNRQQEWLYLSTIG